MLTMQVGGRMTDMAGTGTLVHLVIRSCLCEEENGECSLACPGRH